MNVLKNERGHGMVYLLWIMVMSIAIFVIIINISKVYIVKQQAATATQQAALAGTSVLLEATLRGVENFDSYPDPEHPDWKNQRDADGKSVKALLDERATEHQRSGKVKDIAYVTAMNEVLQSRMFAYGLLRDSISQEINAAQMDFENTIRQVLLANDGNLERSAVTLTTPNYRVEVIADRTYRSITDSSQSYMPDFVENIPQKGYGPSLIYLKSID